MGKRGRNDIAKDGEKSRFGAAGGVDPRQATKIGPPKWSIRKALAHMAAQEVDPKDPKAISKLLGDNPTLAQVIAASALAKASKGDMNAVNYATDNIDGKLPQTNINAEYEAIKGASDEELDAIIAAGLGHQARTGAGDPGEGATPASKGKGVDAVSGSAERGTKKSR